MTAIEFLRKQKILDSDKTHFIIRYEDGGEIDVVQLLENFLKENNHKIESADLFVS